MSDSVVVEALIDRIEDLARAHERKVLAEPKGVPRGLLRSLLRECIVYSHTQSEAALNEAQFIAKELLHTGPETAGKFVIDMLAEAAKDVHLIRTSVKKGRAKKPKGFEDALE